MPDVKFVEYEYRNNAPHWKRNAEEEIAKYLDQGYEAVLMSLQPETDYSPGKCVTLLVKEEECDSRQKFPPQYHGERDKTKYRRYGEL